MLQLDLADPPACPDRPPPRERVAVVSDVRLAGTLPETRQSPMDTEERHIGGLRVTIDRLICVGFETCCEVAPDLFRLDDEGIATFSDGAEETPRQDVLNACRACPVDALTVTDAAGATLVP